MASWKRIGASLLCIALVSPASAQPGGKVVRIVVPFAAGGAREVLARTFYSELGAALGVTAIIDNRPGAGGAIGTASVAKAAPDGQTLIFAASSHNVTALLGANPAYDPIKDFAGVANIGMQSYVLMASASVPAKSTADANNDVLAARSHAVIVPNVGAIPFVKDERIRLLGVTSRKRSAFLPGVPPVAGSVPGYGFDSWFGLLAPAKTPAAVIARINAAVAKLLREPVILARLAGQGVEPRPLSPEAFERLIREDYEDMARVVKAVGRIE